MKDSDRYLKIVEWSEEDQCYIGSAPGLFFGGCHGDDEQLVFAETCEIVDEWIEISRKDGRPLPPATAGKEIVETITQSLLEKSRAIIVESE